MQPLASSLEDNLHPPLSSELPQRAEDGISTPRTDSAAPSLASKGPGFISLAYANCASGFGQLLFPKAQPPLCGERSSELQRDKYLAGNALGRLITT